MSRVAPTFALALVTGCAALRSTVDVTGSPGAPRRAPVPVYYGLGPDFPTEEIGAIEAYGQGHRAHLDDLLDEAEARAQRLGADALLVRDVRTAARYVPRTEMRPCSRHGPGGIPMQFTCPVIVTVLEVDMRLQATAVRRGPPRADVPAPWGASASAPSPSPWGAPPPPGLAEEPPAPRAPRPPALPDLDDALSTPP